MNMQHVVFLDQTCNDRLNREQLIGVILCHIRRLCSVNIARTFGKFFVLALLGWQLTNIVAVALGFHLGRHMLCLIVSPRKVEGERKRSVPAPSTSTDLRFFPLPPAAGLRAFLTPAETTVAFVRGPLTGVVVVVVVVVVVLVVLDLPGVVVPALP